jgi:hypothetical protein
MELQVDVYYPMLDFQLQVLPEPQVQLVEDLLAQQV